MNACRCSRPIADRQSSCERCNALYALGLEHGASGMEVKDAYKTLVKVWHPDRFQNDEPLRKTAGKNLAQINVAYQYLQANPAPYKTSASQDWRPSARTETASYGKSKQENPNSAKGPVADAKSRSRADPNQSSWWVRFLQPVAKYILSDRRWSISPIGTRVLGFILAAFLVRGATFFWQSFMEPKDAASGSVVLATRIDRGRSLAPGSSAAAN